MVSCPVTRPEDVSLVRIRCLVDLLNLEQRPNWQSKRILINKINQLEQVRKTMTGIDNLSVSIDKLGILEPILLVMYDRQKAEAYIELINEEWGTNYAIDDLCPFDTSGNKFAIIIAGHRRLTAMKKLNERFADVRIDSSLPPFVALFVQLAENLHVAVPKTEDAIGRIRVYRLIRKRYPEFALKDYAPHVGVSVDQLRDELKYVDLPEVIQRAAEDGSICFSIAVEFDRLIKQYELDEKIRQCFETQEDWMNWLVEFLLAAAITQKLSIDKFKDHCSYEIKMLISKQLSIFDLEEPGTKKRNFQQAIINRSIDGVRGAIKYCSGVLDYFSGEIPLLEPRESPFLNRQFRRLFIDLLKLLDKVIPHLEFICEAERDLATKKTQRALVLCQALEDQDGQMN